MDQLIVFLLLLSVCRNAYSLNILAIASLPLKSHYSAFGPLFRELASRGHSVTVINNYPDEIPLRNLTFVNLNAVSDANTFPTLQFYEEWQPLPLRMLNVYRHVSVTHDVAGIDCELLLTNKEVTDLFANVKHDVVFVEQFMSDCGLAVAGARSYAPIIGITSHVLLPWAYSRLGLSFDLNSDAFYFSDSSPNPSLYDKIETFTAKGIFNTIGRWIIQRSIHEVFQRHLPEYELDIEKIARERMKMMFSYQHFSLTGARTLSPQVLEIGGLHVGDRKPVPEEIEKFLDKADHGAVYVSFGSNLRSSTMSEEKLHQFLEAFRNIRPLKVLFKWENGSLHDDNVFTKPWFPQLDVLCHPKVIGFVSHGGMLGTSEAATCGVPIVTVPFFGDQFGNAAAVRAAGLGTTLYFNQLTGHTLAVAIRTITSEAFRKRAKDVAALWNDRPMSAMESAIYWTEYVARHPSAPPSLPAQNALWFASLLLDVYTVIIIILLCLFWTLYLLSKILKMFVLKTLRLDKGSDKGKRD